jgi:hypothetical protein
MTILALIQLLSHAEHSNFKLTGSGGATARCFESTLTFVTLRASVTADMPDPKELEPNLPTKRPPARDRWLSRLAFSFVIIGAFLVWQSFHLPAGADASNWRRALYLIAAGLSFGLGIAGIRARHRMIRSDQ